MSDPRIPRRRFLGGLALAGTALATPGLVTSAVAAEPTPDAPGDWDHGWLKRLGAKHRTLFDNKSWGGGEALGQAKRYYDAMVDGYGAKPNEITVVLGLAGASWPIATNDALWEKYKLGELLSVDDPATKTRAVRNIAANDAEGQPFAATSVTAWQKRGAILLVCNNSLRKGSRDLAAKGLGEADAIYADLRAAVLPGITVVPAMVAAIGMAQSRGVSYIVGA